VSVFIEPGAVLPSRRRRSTVGRPVHSCDKSATPGTVVRSATDHRAFDRRIVRFVASH